MNAACHLHLYDDTVEPEVDADPLTLTIKVMPPGAVVCEAEFVFYAKSLDAIRSLGESIIAACDKLPPPPSTTDPWTTPVYAAVEMMDGMRADDAKVEKLIADADAEMIAETLDRR